MNNSEMKNLPKKINKRTIKMNKSMQILSVLFFIATMLFANAYAIDVPSIDDGTDKDGRLGANLFD